MSPTAALALGFVLGLRHATDADHVVAVSTVASREKTMRGALRVGALWSLGHTVTLLLTGGLLVLFGLVVPPRLALGLELGVAAMLVALGASRWRDPIHNDTPHDHTSHADAMTSSLLLLRIPPLSSQHEHRHPPRGAWRPLAIGVVHGLAGTAALTLLALATLRSTALALLYLGVFGVGTVLGMMLLSAALAWPLSFAVRRAAPFARHLGRITGLLSLGLGLFMVYRIGFVDGLFFPEAVMGTAVPLP